MSHLPGPLVSVAWLAGQLLRRPMGLRLVDSSWYMPSAKRDPTKEFEDQHALSELYVTDPLTENLPDNKYIPGAVFLDIDKVADTTHPVPHMLPSPELFASEISKLGISSSDDIVVYDTMGVFSSPRAWWTFRVFGHDRVAVLDGGLPAWMKEGHAIEKGPAVTKPGHFVVNFRKDLVKDKAQMLQNALSDKPGFHIADARGPRGRFDGTVPEPRPGLPNGHMPHSVSLPWSEMVNNHNSAQTLKSAAELEKTFAANGVDLKGPLTVSCGSGLSACVLALSAYTCGKKDVAVYDGSWTEWALDSTTPKLQSSPS